MRNEMMGFTKKNVKKSACIEEQEEKMRRAGEDSANNDRVILRETGLKYSADVEKALRICFSAHKDQTDISGLPYVFHPFHLAEQMETEEEICTALLHDVVEDSEYTLEDLERKGFCREILDAVALLTHDLSVPYMEYICAVRKNKLARKVKIADLKHNSDTARLPVVTSVDRRRLKKYRIALAILEDDWYDRVLGHYRKRIPLDDQRPYYLSVFYLEDGTVKKYSLDLEIDSDSHIEFAPGYTRALCRKLPKSGSFPEALAEFLEDHNQFDFKKLLEELDIWHQTFYFLNL